MHVLLSNINIFFRNAIGEEGFMKNIFNSQAAFSGLLATALLVSGCESNTVDGYFGTMPSSATATSAGSSNTSTTSPVGGSPTSGAPISVPTAGPTMVPTSVPTVTITPTPVPTVTKAPTPPTPTPTPTPSSSPTPVALPSTFVPNGILNGHFDVDTATTSMPFPTGKGTVTYHVHEYDKLNQTTTVDFFNIINSNGTPEDGNDFDQVQKTIPKGKRFYLVVVNPSLNPGGVLEVNGTVLRVTDYQNLTQQLLASGVRPAAYTIGAPSTAGDVQLTSLKIAFDSNVTADELLVPTGPTACVFPDIAGKLDASAIELNASTGAATSNGGLIWEGIIYNHHMIVEPNGTEVDPEMCY
jgi:hypothetical protein